MNLTLLAKQQGIAQVCEQYAVRRLDVFGSALRADFDPAPSDIDLVVEFAPPQIGKDFDRYFAFKAALEALLARPVDLVELGSMRSTRLRKHVERERVQVYGPQAA